MQQSNRKRRRFAESDEDEDEPEIINKTLQSPNKKRRRTIQLSQSDDEDEATSKAKRSKKTHKNSSSQRKKQKETPASEQKQQVNRTPQPLKLTEAKPDESPFVPDVGATPAQSTSSPATSSKKKSARKQKAGDTPKSHDIRKFFGAPTTAADFFSQWDNKPNYSNLKTQTNVVKEHAQSNETQNKNKENDSVHGNGHSNAQNSEAPMPPIVIDLVDAMPQIVIDLVDDDDEDDAAMQNNDAEADGSQNKPLQRRPKTPTKQTTQATTKVVASPGLANTIEQLSCTIPVVDSPANDDNDNDGDAKHDAMEEDPTQQAASGQKRKLDEIDNDRASSTQSTNPTNPTAASDPPPAKKKWYPGFQRQDMPPQHGSTEIPTGKPYCLGNLRIVISGQLPSLTRPECEDLIKQYGGRVTGSVSGMTSYLLCGEDAGESKTKKAKEKKVGILSEAQFLDLLRTLPAGKEPQAKAKKTTKRGSQSQSQSRSSSQSASIASSGMGTGHGGGGSASASGGGGDDMVLLVDKYKPRCAADLIGNPKCISDLRQHLLNWERMKNAGSGRGRNAIKKGVLVSGQPGIGKTSAVHVVARELGYKTVEFNASDTRSKKKLQELVKQSLDNRTMTDFFAVQGQKPKPKGAADKNLIIMDEVDGMSSGDRGGLAELVGYIQNSKVPIICICNDRSKPNLRTLGNYCLELRFRKPTSKQIAGRLSRIAQMEGFSMDLPSIEKLADGTNGDVRQMLNTLQFWSNDEATKRLSYMAVKERMASATKDMTMGPWDVTPKLFHSSTSLMQGIECFFVDHEMMPFFVQEHYLNLNKGGGGYGSRPTASTWSKSDLECIASASSSIADSDLVLTRIKKYQQYGTLQHMAILSAYKPGQLVAKCGRVGGRIGFPCMLGKISNRNKNERNFTELAVNMSGSSGSGGAGEDDAVDHCDVTGNTLTMEYMPILKHLAMQPLIRRQNDGIDEVVQFMKQYHLNREDWNVIAEMGEYSGVNKSDVLKQISTKTKSAFTRRCTAELSAVNKENAKKKKKGDINDLKTKDADDVRSESEGDDMDGDDDQGDVDKDSMIKKVTKGKKTTKPKKKTDTKSKKKPAKKTTTRKRKK